MNKTSNIYPKMFHIDAKERGRKGFIVLYLFLSLIAVVKLTVIRSEM